MKKQINKIGMALLGLCMIITPAWAADYTSMTTDELSALRGTMRDAAPEERSAFQEEWQSRLQNMTTAERQQYSGRPANAIQDGAGMKYGKGGGSGQGGGMGGRGGNGGGGGGNR